MNYRQKKKAITKEIKENAREMEKNNKFESRIRKNELRSDLYNLHLKRVYKKFNKLEKQGHIIAPCCTK